MVRPELLVGKTYKLKAVMADGKDLKFYVTINKDEQGKACEIFVNVRDAAYWEHLTTVTVLISRLLQAGIAAKVIAEDLKQIHSPITFHRVKGRPDAVPSVYARLGELLEKEA